MAQCQECTKKSIQFKRYNPAFHKEKRGFLMDFFKKVGIIIYAPLRAYLIRGTMKNTFYLNLSTADELGIGLFKCVWSDGKKFIAVNSAFASMLGYSSKKDLEEIGFGDLFSNKKERDRFFKALDDSGNVKLFQTTLKNKNNKKIWFAITAFRIIAKNKRQYIEGIVENISSLKKMEDELRLERDYLQGLLDNLPDAVYFKDTKNRILRVNKFYADGVNMKSQDIVGKTDFDFFPHDQAKLMFKDDNYVLNTGKPIVGKIERTLLSNGTWNQVITTKIPMYDRGGKIIGTMGITRDMTAYANLENDRMTMLINSLGVLGKAMELRDPYTFGHARNVAAIAQAIGKELGWDKNHLLGIRMAAELHDLGKISIPLDILNKPGKLTDIELKLIQEHVKKCYELIRDVDFPFPLAETIYQHHERLDGSGYPRKLRGRNIIPEARVLAVSDVLEAMTQYRPYREALGIERACEELMTGVGVKYDKKIVDTVLKLVNKNKNQIFWENS